MDNEQGKPESHQPQDRGVSYGDFIVGIWRGGTPVGIVVQELLDYCGIVTDHISIRTSSYVGIDQRGREIRVHGLNYVVKNIKAEDAVLIVDDVYETGLSIKAVIDTLTARARHNTPKNIRIATVYYKPARNLTDHASFGLPVRTVDVQ